MTEYLMDKITNYSKDGHKIIWGDALSILDEAIEDASIHLIFADPPYNIGKRFGNFVDR